MRITRSTSVVSTPAEGGFLVFSVATRAVFRADPIAARALEICDGREEAEIVGQLVSECALNGQELQQLYLFLEDAKRKKLVIET